MDSNPIGDARDVDADLARLVWAEPRLGGRGPKPALTRDEVVTAGIAVADRQGLSALSMKQVAEQLATSAPGLYRYIPGKSGLIALMVEFVMGEDDPDPTVTGWKSKLEHHARQDWLLYHRHPWLLEVPLGRMPPGPNTTGRFDRGLAAALESGLTPAEALNAFLAIDHLVTGAARDSVEDLAVLKRGGGESSAWWMVQGEVVIAGRLARGEFPALAAVVVSGAFESNRVSQGEREGFRDGFERELQLLLAGIEAHVSDRRSAPRS